MIPTVTKIDSIVDKKRANAIPRSGRRLLHAPGAACPNGGPTEFLANDDRTP